MQGVVQIGAIREFGLRVRQRREAAGMTQAELAAKADLDRLYLGRLERGRQNPSLLVVARLTVELDVGLDEIFAGIEVAAEEVRAIRRLSRGPGSATSDDASDEAASDAG